MIEFNNETVNNISSATSREWLETNGLGGFASSSIIGLNTRRYHGLLTAATNPPVGRIVMLSKLEETLIVNGRRYELSANQYPGTIHPQGFQYQTGFRLDPFPMFTYEVEGLRLEKSVFMVQGQNSTVVHYELQPGALPDEQPSALIKLEIRPLVAFRDYHSTMHENSSLNSDVETSDGITTVAPYNDLPALHLAHDSGEIDINGFWYRNFQYGVEQERGLDFAEDLFSPFSLTFDLTVQSRARIIASTERHDVQLADQYRNEEIERRRTIST